LPLFTERHRFLREHCGVLYEMKQLRWFSYEDVSSSYYVMRYTVTRRTSRLLPNL